LRIRSIRITYDENGRSVRRPRNIRRIVLIVVAVLVLIWIVGYILFNIGGTVPGTGEGDIIQTP
jgi:nicotinamide riboside transporter PnuC